MTHVSQTAWLFTRGRESVRLEVRHSAETVELLVSGPGGRRETYSFADTLAALVHQAEVERRLVGRGFFLEQFITDRRRHSR
jgi:hypothetical protein